MFGNACLQSCPTIVAFLWHSRAGVLRAPIRSARETTEDAAAARHQLDALEFASNTPRRIRRILPARNVETHSLLARRPRFHRLGVRSTASSRAVVAPDKATAGSRAERATADASAHFRARPLACMPIVPTNVPKKTLTMHGMI